MVGGKKKAVECLNLKESISYFVFQSTFIHNASLNNHTNQIKPIMRTETITGEVIRPSLSKRIMIGALIYPGSPGRKLLPEG